MEADWDGRIGDVGAGLKPFERKVAGSDNLEYAVDDAERKDLAYLVENSCISCNKQLRTQEVKIVPPRYIQERDHYVRSGAISRRLMCVACYNTLKTVTRTRIRIRHNESATTKRNFLMKTVINNLLLK
jgi:RNase P subunit RPR2